MQYGFRPVAHGLLQRVRFTLVGRDGADGSRIDASSRCEGEIFHAVSMKQPGETKVSFDAARLGIYSVFLVVLPDEILLGSPGPRPHRRILDRYGIFKRVRAGPRPPLDDVKILARPLKIGLRTEIRHVDHEGVALPVPT